VDREAFTAWPFIHEERRGSVRSRQQPSTDQFQPGLVELRWCQLIADPLRQPLLQVVALAAADLDRMADLDDIEPVRIERIFGEARIGRWRGCDAVHGPADRAATDERQHHRRRSPVHPAPRPADDLLDLEPLRDRLVDHTAIALLQLLGHRAPGCDPRRIVGMRPEPGLDGRTAVV